MAKREFQSQFPLPVPVLDRTTPEDYIPDCDDTYGYGQRMWDIFSNLKVTQGAKAGKRFGDPGVAPPWQKKLIISLFGTCDENGIRDYDETLLYCGKKQGKALDIKTPILTPNGWVEMGDLTVGDFVYGGDGKPVVITNVTETMFGHNCYKVDLSDRRSLTADEDHLWTTIDRSGRSHESRNLNHKSQWKVRTTLDIKNSLVVSSNNELNHKIQSNPVLHKPHVDLPLPPYILGFWLGDGTEGKPVVTVNSLDINEVEWRFNNELGFVTKVTPYSDDRLAHNLSMTSFGHFGEVKSKLNMLGVLNNKHIPESYMQSSPAQRKALLQGLLDSDGTVNKGFGKYPVGEFNSCLDTLADGVEYLLISLGFKVTRTTRVGKLYGVAHKISHRIRFTSFQEDNLFYITRKNKELRCKTKTNNRSDTVKIKSVKQVESVPVCCISVGNEDGIFLAGKGLIPTHNSSYSGPLAVAFVLAYPIVRGNIIILAATLKQAQIIYDSMAATIRADKSLSKLFHVRDYKKDVKHIKTGTVIQAVALEAGNIVGQIVDGFFCDEAHVIGLMGKAKQLIEQLTSGQSTIPNPFTLYTTTAPLKKSSGVFSSLYARATRIINGESPHDRLLPIMFELPEDMDTDNHNEWWRCCPSIDYTVPKQWLVEKYNTAKLDPDPTTLQNFYTQHLNKILVDGMGVDKFLPVLIWRNAIDRSISFQSILDNSILIYAGVDLGFRDDPSAILVGGVDENGVMSVWCEQYLHYDGYEKRKNTVEYDVFIESGELLISNEESFDVECVTKIVIELQETGKLAGVGVDPMGLESWAQEMEDKYPKINIMAIPQGYKMSPSIMETERWIFGGRIKHQGLPMLEWNIENTSLKKHGEAVALIKPEDIQRSGLKIDGCIGLVECVAMAADPEIKPKKVNIEGMIA